MILKKIGFIIILNFVIINLCYSQNKKDFRLIIIDNEITIQNSQKIDSVDSINWITLPHCSYVYFKEQFDKNPKIRNGISISENWEKNLGEKFDTCSTILMIRYRGDGNFSGGGDDIACYLLSDNDRIDIMKVGNKNDSLYSIEIIDGKLTIKIKNWKLNLEDDNDSFSTSYYLNEKVSTILISEKFKIKKYIKTYQNSTVVGCM